LNAAWYAQKASPGFSEEMHCFAVFMDIAPLAAQSMANVVFLKYESGRLVHPHIFRVDWLKVLHDLRMQRAHAVLSKGTNRRDGHEGLLQMLHSLRINNKNDFWFVLLHIFCRHVSLQARNDNTNQTSTRF
jgi:hypothetical protein